MDGQGPKVLILYRACVSVRRTLRGAGFCSVRLKNRIVPPSPIMIASTTCPRSMTAVSAAPGTVMA